MLFTMTRGLPLNATRLLTRSGGWARAELFNECPSRYKRVNHRTDSVLSDDLKMVLVDNVKAGSQSARGRFKDVAGVHWQHWDARFRERRKTCAGCCDRTTSACLSPSVAREYVVWSIVRDPVAKFESGVRQIWAMGGPDALLSADELMAKQLRLPPGAWVDEHAMPSAWRLSGRLAGDVALPRYAFLASLEELSVDWPAVIALVVDHAPAAIDEPRRRALRRALAARLPRKNGHATRNAKTGKSSVLSAASVRAMCASPHYGEEWGCFGYALPEVCRTPAREKGPGARNRTRARQSGKLDHIHGG